MWVKKDDLLDGSGHKRREIEGIVGVVVHRIEVSQEDPTYEDSVSDTARFFLEHEVGVRATGGAMPYPVLVLKTGEVVQTLPLDRVTPHAKAHNPTTVGVACIGDFREAPPSAPQYEALVLTCASLLHQLGLGVEALAGHDELSGGSSDPEKECPGRGLGMEGLRRETEKALEVGAFAHFTESG